jgi:RNA polymerase sigma factor (sigma-70 family)
MLTLVTPVPATGAPAEVLDCRDRIEDPTRAAAYLRSTAFNLARTGLRRRLRRPDLLRRLVPRSAEDGVVQAGEPDALDGLILAERQRAVLRALLSLPARQRACVVLRYYGGVGVDDISTELGISRNSVKTHLRRGLESLGQQLEALR